MGGSLRISKCVVEIRSFAEIRKLGWWNTFLEEIREPKHVHFLNTLREIRKLAEIRKSAEIRKPKYVNWQKSVTYGFNIHKSRNFCMIGVLLGIEPMTLNKPWASYALTTTPFCIYNNSRKDRYLLSKWILPSGRKFCLFFSKSFNVFPRHCQNPSTNRNPQIATSYYSHSATTLKYAAQPTDRQKSVKWNT